MRRDSDWGGHLVFFLLGAATGAAVALLYAPQEGEVTRRKIGEKAGEYKDKATEVSTNVRQNAKEKVTAATERVQELINRSQKVAQSATASAEEEAPVPANSTE